jgi:hypothetical protein
MKDSNIGEWIEKLRMAAMKAVSEEDIREIFQNLAKRAKQGDAAAIKMLMTYLQPPPPPAAPILNPPAQRVTAKVVNIYANGRKKNPKLLKETPFELNGNGR